MSNAPEIRNVFIRRPIFSGVISIVIVLLGLFALRTLPVNSYPALTPPEIQVHRTSPRPWPRRSSSSSRGSTGCSISSRRTRAPAS